MALNGLRKCFRTNFNLTGKYLFKVIKKRLLSFSEGHAAVFKVNNNDTKATLSDMTCHQLGVFAS